MQPVKKKQPTLKSKIHTRNQHRERYDFPQLVRTFPPLAEFVRPNKYGDDSVDFSNPEAVKTLNKALLRQYYGVNHWNVPEGYLCPPIPGRADYIHHIADVLGASNGGKVPRGSKINCLDIGTGASCIYPIIGNTEYGWSFVGTDTDPVSIKSAATILERNEDLHGHVELRLQSNRADTYQGILLANERFDLSICNPPFHASMADAQKGSIRKVNNLKGHKGKKLQKAVLNFGGQAGELCCEGGEVQFVGNMIAQSQVFPESCFWYSSLVSKQTNLERIERKLGHVGVADSKVIEMGQGNKSSRLVAWTFLNKEQQQAWKKERWG